MNNLGATRYRWEDMPKEELKPDLHRRLVSTERMMLAHVYLDKGCIVPQHSHENEQLTYILQGTLRFFLGEDESEVVEVAAGEVLHIPRGFPHKAEASTTCSTSTSSVRRARTGSTGRTPTSATSEPRAGRQGRPRLRREPLDREAIANELAAEGASLGARSRDGDRLSVAAAEIGTEVLAIPADLAEPGRGRASSGQPRSASGASTSSWPTRWPARRHARQLSLEDWDLRNGTAPSQHGRARNSRAARIEVSAGWAASSRSRRWP